MKKIILALTIIMFLSFSTQTQAAWYDWFLGVKKEASVETKNQGEPKPSVIQTTQKKSETTPDTQKPAAETESLKAEVATLKVNLDKLYKAHNGLVEDFKTLLQVTASFRNELKNTSQAPVGSDPESKITSLENKVENICRRVFSNTIAPLPGGTSCPSGAFLQESFETRIKKLESGY